MKIYKAMLFCFLYTFIGSCTRPTNDALWSMIKSNNMDSIIDATIEIEETNNSKMIDALLYTPYDARITHRLNLYGMSIYQIKMGALGTITGFPPPKKLTCVPDSTVVNFYRQFGKNKVTKD